MKTFVDFLASNLREVIPLKTIFPYQKGVRFTFGHTGAELDEGMHWYVPFFQRIEIVDSAPQVINLPTQSLETKEGNGKQKVPIAVSTTIEYEVTSARDYWTKVQQAEDSLANMAMGEIAHVVSSTGYEDLDIGRLEGRVLESIKDRAKDWGLKVNRVYFTDTVKHRAIRLLSDTQPNQQNNGEVS